MKKSEAAIGKRVKLNDFVIKQSALDRLGVGEITSEPVRANGSLYNVAVRWADGKTLTHPLIRLQEVAW